jgi:hypothetical protein
VRLDTLAQRRGQSADTRKRFRLAFSRDPTLAGDAYAEVPQGVVEPFDAGEQAPGAPAGR